MTYNIHDLFTQLSSFISTAVFLLSQFWLQVVDLVVVGLTKYLLNEPVFIRSYKFVDSGYK